MNQDLETMQLDELKKLRRDVDTAIRSYQDRERKKALSVLEERAQEMGYSLSELTSSTSKSRKVYPPKYRDPDNASNTWSGRGRQPGWVKKLLEDGKSLDDYAI